MEDPSVRMPEGEPQAREFNEMAERIAEKLAGTVSELRRVREALARGQSDLLAHQRRLASANRLAALGALAARLAHELGTPLHSVAGHLDLLLSHPGLPADVLERGQVIAGEVGRLSALIRQHLKRLRSPQPEFKPTDLGELLQRILRVLGPILEARGVGVHCDVDPLAREPFSCDPQQVEQVVMNLVQNALDAMQDGGRLIVRASLTESGRAISVADNGSGVSPDIAQRVFEPFFTTKGAGHGTGLGLALCREIAHNHGGDIVLDSKPGIGTVVTFTLGAPDS